MQEKKLQLAKQKKAIRKNSVAGVKGLGYGGVIFGEYCRKQRKCLARMQILQNNIFRNETSEL